MFELGRTVRFAVGPSGVAAGLSVGPSAAQADNGYAGHPSMIGLGAHYELDIACRGDADPVTGYCLNIRQIDRAAREGAVPVIARAFADGEKIDPTALLGEILDALRGRLPNLARVRWRLSPTYSIEMEPDTMAHVILRQSFEFAAAHRLHAPSLSDTQNRALFGKCNNPAGHGHNYRLEPAVRASTTADKAPIFTLRDLERITTEQVIEHLDHKHLNCDVPEFADLNPSVENIARVCYDRLRGPIRSAGAELRFVTVWETEKTSCVYPA